jgi:hypothetical protein
VSAVNRRERADLATWLFLVGLGLLVTWLAVRGGARLGTASAPFLGSYRFVISPLSIVAPAVAVVILLATWHGRIDTMPWWRVQFASATGLFAWSVALALVDGADGLTRSLTPDNYLGDVQEVGDDPLGYLRSFTGRSAEHTIATRGHPPAPVLLLWAIQRLGISGQLTLALLVTGFGALAAPLVLSAIRDVSGESAARRFAPIVMLAPYAVWLAVSMDAVVLTIAAAMTVAGLRATRNRGWQAGLWALLAGVLLGVAAMFSYAAAWLGLSIVAIYFARRRAALNLFSGLGALIPILLAWLAGFAWTDGLFVAYADFSQHIEPERSELWWGLISICALLIAVGPVLVASLRKLRNTPGWPFMLGAATAVVFSIGAGLARGGIEHAWLPFFPWLTVAAIAPDERGGPPTAAPLLLVAVGALTAIVIEAVLQTPW